MSSKGAVCCLNMLACGYPACLVLWLSSPGCPGTTPAATCIGRGKSVFGYLSNQFQDLREAGL